MTLKKVVARSETLNFLFSYHSYIYFCLMFLLLLVSLSNQKVQASSFIEKQNYKYQLGYEQRQQQVIFSQATTAYDQQDYIYSARLFSILAEQGHAKAQYILASQYDSGLGVDSNKEAAFHWYKKAAWAGVHVAQHNLAVSFVNGQGTEINLTKAIYWWKRAAKGGSADAQYNLGIIYASGHGSIEPNLKKALKWWRMAAINGDAIAQFNLGALYANGIGFSSRTCEASRWWKKSAENGFSQAKVALALLETKTDYDICR